MLGVENIYKNQKEKINVKEESVLTDCAQSGCEKIVKFQIISLVASGTCELDQELQYVY